MYAILLPSERFPENKSRPLGIGWAYVGRTSNTVEKRFASHFDPGSKAFNKKWDNLGIKAEDCELMHDVHSNFNPVAKEPKERDAKQFRGNKATYAEHYLHKLLEQSGYCVEGDGGTAFNIKPRKKKSKR